MNEFIDRHDTNSFKWEFMNMMDQNVPEGTLPFWVADMDFPCADPIIKALHKRVDRQIFGYSMRDTAEYFRAVCGWYQHRYDWYLNSSDLFYCAGVVPALGYLIDVLTEPGEGVIIQSPVYYPFKWNIENHNRSVINNPLINKSGYYEIDFEDLERKAKEFNTTLAILCSPHNPVGRIWKEEELIRFGRICKENNVFIVSDEIHGDLVRRGLKHIPLEKAFPEYRNKIITATAPSKTFNLAGMPMSNIIIHDKEIQEKWKKYCYDFLNIDLYNPLTIKAVQAAYAESEDWLEQVIDYLDNNMAYIEQFLKENLSKARYQRPEATYLVWIDVRDYGYSSEQISERMLNEAKVFIEEGTAFGEEGAGYIRMNVACPFDLLKEGLNRMARVLNEEVAYED